MSLDNSVLLWLLLKSLGPENQYSTEFLSFLLASYSKVGAREVGNLETLMNEDKKPKKCLLFNQRTKKGED